MNVVSLVPAFKKEYNTTHELHFEQMALVIHTAWNPARFNTYDLPPDLDILLLWPLQFHPTAVVGTNIWAQLSKHPSQTQMRPLSVIKWSWFQNIHYLWMKNTGEKCSQTSTKKHTETIDQSDQTGGGWCTHSLSVCSIPPGQLINCCSSIAAQNHSKGSSL